MKLKVFSFLVLLIPIAGQVIAQETSLTTEQQEVIQQIALEINSVCPVPPIPAIPDGDNATRDDMLNARNALQAYIDDSDTYLGCLEKLETDWGEDITANQSAVVNALYNRNVENLQTSADAFNAELRLYQDANTD